MSFNISFLSHLVQIKLFTSPPYNILKDYFLSHLVQIKPATSASLFDVICVFLSHLVQIKRELLIALKYDKRPFYPT